MGWHFIRSSLNCLLFQTLVLVFVLDVFRRGHFCRVRLPLFPLTLAFSPQRAMRANNDIVRLRRAEYKAFRRSTKESLDNTRISTAVEHVVKFLQWQNNVFVEALLDLRIFKVEGSRKGAQLAFDASEDDLGIFVMIAGFDGVLIHETGGDAEFCKAWEPRDIRIDTLFEGEYRYTEGYFDQCNTQCE